MTVKRTLSYMVALGLLTAGCTKETDHIFYVGGNPSGTDAGSIVGVVKPAGSGAKVVVRQATPVDSTLVNPQSGVFRIDNLKPGNYDVAISADRFGTRRMRNVSVLAGGVTYVGEVELSTMPDLVDVHFPEDKGEVVFDRRFDRLAISIAFTRPMDRASVEAAFSTDPPSEGVFYWGEYVSQALPYYYFDPSSPGAYDRYANGAVTARISTYRKIGAFTYLMARKDSHTDMDYTVVLSTAAKDTSGAHLPFPLRFRFSTVQSAVTQNAILTVPVHGDIDVDLIRHGGIQLSFPRRMDPVSMEGALTLTPGTDRILIWPDPARLVIYTGGPLLADTLYALQVNRSALDADGVPLGDDFEFSFRTRPVEITATTPANGELFVRLNPSIVMTFDTYMIKSTVEAAFRISPAVPGQIIWGYPSGGGEPGNVLSFVPGADLAANTKYTVTIGTTARDMYGKGLKTPYTFAFVTRPQ